jgi:hypothetical protein
MLHVEQNQEIFLIWIVRRSFFDAASPSTPASRYVDGTDITHGSFSTETSPGLSVLVTVSIGILIMLAAPAPGSGGPLARSSAV